MAAQLQMQAESEHSNATAPEVRWQLGTRVAFRFAFAYFVLYNTLLWRFLPYAEIIAGPYNRLWHTVVLWVGKHVLHLSYPITVYANGSGDTTYDYVHALCYLILAAAATLAWSLADRHRGNYQRLHQWFTVYLRLCLAVFMMSYGATKLIDVQFPAPPLSRLFTTNGDSTPMSLLWTFMGASKSYTFFAGAVEMLGGALLIVPRLTTLGALVCAASVTNVFILNMSYDVPVKLFSFHLLLMSGLLLAPDLRRLADFFILNRKTEPTIARPFFQRKWLNRGFLAAQLVFGIYAGGWWLHNSYHAAVTRGDLAPKPPLYGIWMVDEFSIDGKGQPAAEPARWQRVFMDSYSEMCIQSVGGKRQRFIHTVDMAKNTLTIWKRETPAVKTKFTVGKLPGEMITIDGTFDGHATHAKLHRMEEPKFMLTSRGFHWINEYPFNRFNE